MFLRSSLRAIGSFLLTIKGVLPLVVFAQWGNTAASKPSAGPAIFAQSTARWFLAILIILSVVGILVGIVYIVSAGGDDDRVDHGRRCLIFSGVSIIIVIIGFIILGMFSA